MSIQRLRTVGVLVVFATAVTAPFLGVARQISPVAGTPTPIECGIEPLALADILALRSESDGAASPVSAPATPSYLATPVGSSGSATPDPALAGAIEQTVMGANACRAAGDVLRYFAYFTDGYIVRAFADGSLSDESLLGFGETSAQTAQRVVAIQTIQRRDDGGVGGVVVTTSSSTGSTGSEDRTIVVDEVDLVLQQDGWRIDRIRRLAAVPLSVVQQPVETSDPRSTVATTITMPTGASVPPAGAVVELSAPGIAWSTNEITIPQGGTINLFNDGSGGEHNFVVEGYNDDAPVDMPIGETVPWVVPDDIQPGVYTFYCGVPGHRALMEGTINVTP